MLAGTRLAAVDFARDVQPLIEKNCIGCHGPEQQMNAFRLDRRSAAMRGGTRSVIVPGNSAASRLYLRLAGNQFGTRMPTTGPLKPDEIAVFKTWIDEGAHWPDALANEPVTNAPSTALMNAVLYSNAREMQELLAHGADVNAKNNAQATALMWAADNLEKTRLLLEHGAEVNATSADGRTALLIAAGLPGNSAIVQALLEAGANPNPKGRAPGDTSPLREAASIGDVASMRLLIAKGANVRHAAAGALTGALEVNCYECVELLTEGLSPTAYTRALLQVAVASNFRQVKFALDHGANVNAADGDGRTALMYAANNDRLPLETVRLLLERGADVNAKNREGFTALDAARLHGETPIVALLIQSGAKGAGPMEESDGSRKTPSIAVAVARTLPLIQKADLNFTRKSGCVSCHNEALTEMALADAESRGFRVNDAMAKQEVRAVVSFFEEWRERLLQGMAPGGPAYTLQGLHARKYPADKLTDAIARYIRLHQFTDGHWGVGCGGSRNPLCGDEITNTANSLRALQFYGPNTGAVERAAAWLKSAPVYTHEDRTFRVFGLVWAGAEKSVVRSAVNDLLATQHQDGGWSDNPYLKSTAYATGEALVALDEAGLSMTDPVRRRAVAFLLRTQREDGSWHVKSHSYGTQPYFDNGFPYGTDQWISAAATNWATMALARSAPPLPQPR